MKLKINFLYYLFPAFLIFLSLNGCSVIGYTIGAVSDSNIPDSTVLPVNQLSKIKQGDDITIKLKNGTYVHGYYMGLKNFNGEPVLKIAGNFAKKLYSLEEIDQIIIYNPKNGKTTGLLIGAAIDITVIVFIISSFEYPSIHLGPI